MRGAHVSITCMPFASRAFEVFTSVRECSVRSAGGLCLSLYHNVTLCPRLYCQICRWFVSLSLPQYHPLSTPVLSDLQVVCVFLPQCHPLSTPVVSDLQVVCVFLSTTMSPSVHACSVRSAGGLCLSTTMSPSVHACSVRSAGGLCLYLYHNVTLCPRL